MWHCLTLVMSYPIWEALCQGVAGPLNGPKITGSHAFTQGFSIGSCSFALGVVTHEENITWKLFLHYWPTVTGIYPSLAGLILGLRLAYERQRYKVTPSLIGWVAIPGSYTIKISTEVHVSIFSPFFLLIEIKFEFSAIICDWVFLLLFMLFCNIKSLHISRQFSWMKIMKICREMTYMVLAVDKPDPIYIMAWCHLDSDLKQLHPFTPVS